MNNCVGKDWEMRFDGWKATVEFLRKHDTFFANSVERAMIDVIDVAREQFVAGHEFYVRSGIEPSWPHVKVGQMLERLHETVIEAMPPPGWCPVEDNKKIHAMFDAAFPKNKKP